MRKDQSVNSIPRIKALYESMDKKLAQARERFGRGLTLAEKILVVHAIDFDNQEWKRGSAQLSLQPDRVAMQDVTGQMALLQFMQAGKQKVQLPSTLHCDHLIVAQSGASSDLQRSIDANKEVFDFLKSACRKYDIGFWKPGAGIIHQVVLEHYAVPGTLLIGSDSHTPNAGGLGMLAIGVGGADCAEVMAGLAWGVLQPKLIGVRLTGKLSGWASPKDVIVYLCGVLSVKGGTNKIIEYFGPGTASISATGKATICNMGAEVGATTSLFPFDEKSAVYLSATGREEIAQLARKHRKNLVADPEVETNPEKYYDEIIDINLSELEPQITGPHSPDRTRPISKLAAEVSENKWPDHISDCLIGSCTNSSYEDMTRAANIAKQALEAGLKVQVPLLVTPGSEQIFSTIKRDGIIDVFEAVGAVVLANACGPCIGQWKRDDVKSGEANTIVSSFNRNFAGRNDGSQATLSFLTSPDIVTAMAFSGSLSFNPLQEKVKLPNGEELKFKPPVGEELPSQGFASTEEVYEVPAENEEAIEIVINPESTRLQILEPFPAWDGKDFVKLPILIKTKGKTTTDHISPAGSWLRLRGHLDRLSDNMFLGATNAFTDEIGKGTNVLTGETGIQIHQIARSYKAQGLGSVVIGPDNYGEGSSREHAAMSPRFLNVRVIIVKGFARIHESNLKKQGILPLIFEKVADYDIFEQEDRVSVVGLADIAPGKPITVVVHKSDGKTLSVQTRHTLSEEQIAWFRAGSAMNAIRGVLSGP